MALISCRILSFKSSRDQGRCLKTFSFRYPQRKKSHGLNLVTVPATPRLPLRRSNAQGTFLPTLRANVVLCELWPRPIETTHVLYPHRPVWGAERSPTFQRTGWRSQLLLHHLPQKSTGRSHQSRQLHTSYARRAERSFLELTRVTFSPVAKILLVYGSADMEVSLIATQKNSCSGNLFKNFRTYGCAVGMISLN